jgi:hypothetical protein
MPAALARSLRNQPFTTVPLLGFRLCGDGVNWFSDRGPSRDGLLGAFIGSRRFARLVVLGVGSSLANCSGGAGRIDPRYGVAASPRVVEPGCRCRRRRRLIASANPTPSLAVFTPEETSITARSAGFVVRRRLSRALHRERRNLRHDVDFGGASDAAAAVLCGSTNLANNRSIVTRVNDRGPMRAIG